MARVVITGAGTINALGQGLGSTWAAMAAGQSGIGALAFRDVERLSIRIGAQIKNFDPQTQSRKINADIFIDDRNLGGFPGWGEVYQIITKKIEFSLHEHGKEREKKKKRGFFGL